MLLPKLRANAASFPVAVRFLLTYPLEPQTATRCLGCWVHKPEDIVEDEVAPRAIR